MTNALVTIRSYLSFGNDVLVASTIPAADSHFSKRSVVHLEKRIDKCTSSTYCEDGYHCIGNGLCGKNFNWYWIVALVVLFFSISIYTCIRRRRIAAAATMAPVPVVETIAVVPQNQYSAYPPPQNYAPPAGDPNMAYQTPATYAAPAGSPAPMGYAAPGMYAPPAGSPYPEKPYSAPVDAPPPAAYSPYPPPSTAGPAYSAPYSPAPYSAAAAAPATAYPAPYSTRGPQSVGHAAPAPYPVPQGEASSYAPPK
ncbi:hypothetical protein BGZ97_000052 [Linnemannia gamsii]|uniref:Uncharacterized protein n=1 Tax=Linnemannia gamsii TaxID=64522 RepID=A0A9P6UWU4_9FUNG|nr:hypothetical protein BGZ97_000052 [Linnemannia gamsii]